MRLIGKVINKKRLAKMPLLARVVSLYAVAGMTLWLGFVAYNQVYPPKAAAVVVEQSPASPQPKANISARRIVSGKPSRMVIERLKIDLPVIDGVYDERAKEWSLSNDSVHFATITDLPNDNRGNTVLYGHNQNRVIGRMSDIKPGDVLIVKTTNDHEFRYAYTHDELVKPNDVNVLYASSPRPQLTVMTCDGFWSQARRLMYFELLEAR